MAVDFANFFTLKFFCACSRNARDDVGKFHGETGGGGGGGGGGPLWIQIIGHICEFYIMLARATVLGVRVHDTKFAAALI